MLNTGVIQRETGPVQATFITEPQLYFVLMRSRSEQARPFRQWVVNEVLPSIRKTGAYSTARALGGYLRKWIALLMARGF